MQSIWDTDLTRESQAMGCVLSIICKMGIVVSMKGSIWVFDDEEGTLALETQMAWYFEPLFIWSSATTANTYSLFSMVLD